MDCRSAFVACFSGTSNDENKGAQIVINHTGMKPHFEYVDDRTPPDEIEKTIFDHEIIFLLPASVPGRYSALCALRVFALVSMEVPPILCLEMIGRLSN
jgi:hypothetical protein